MKKAEDDIRLSIADKEKQLKFLAAITPLNKKNPTASKVAIQILLHDVETFSRISVINTNGKEWLRLDKFPLALKEQNPVSNFSSPIFQQPMLELKTYLGNIQWHEGYQLPFIDLSIPVRDRMTGIIDGVLWARISFQEIQSLLESYLPAQGKLMLVQAGTDRLLVEADDTKFDFSDLESEALADVMRQKGKKTGTLEKSQDDLNITFIYRVFNLDDLRFILLYYQPNNQIFSLANQLRNNNIYVTLGGILLFGLINFLLIRLINTPLRTLTNKIRDISHHYRLKSDKEQDEIAIIKGDEVRQLESVFDFFQKQLSVYSEEIETFNQTLGEQVWRKTEELRRQLHERERAENALASEKERLATTLRSIGDGVITTDINGKVVLINKIAEKLTGWSREKAVGKPIAEVFNIVNEKTRKLCDSPVLKVLEERQIIALANHKILIARDGVERNIADNCAPICDKESNTIGVVLVFRDVTEQLKTEKQLEQSRKIEALTTFAAGATHELATPLSTIAIASGEILHDILNNCSDEEELHDDISLIRDQVERCKYILQQMAAIAGQEGGEKAVSFSIKKLVDDILIIFNPDAFDQIAVDIQVANQSIVMPLHSLSRVVRGLLRNSIEASEEGKTIFLSCYENATYLFFEIRDQGRGMDEKTLKRAIDPFFTTKPPGHNLGLGLYLAQSLASQFGGSLQIASSPLQGTTITISFVKDLVYT